MRRVIKGFKRLFKNLIRAPLYFVFYIKGIVRFRWDRLASDFTTDLFKYQKATLKQKIWAYRRGFLSERINRYGLNENNYMNYMSDLDFYKKKMYKNQRFVYWFDDKLTTWYILQPFSQYLPIHYYSIENKKIRQLYDNGTGINNNVDGILQLIKLKGELAFKKTRGGHGSGFMKVSYKDDEYSINNEATSVRDLRSYIETLNGYIITEYLYSHRQLRKIYDATPSVLRLVTIYDEFKGAQITGSLIRIGSRKTGLITDVDGSILCGVDISDGTLFKPMIDNGDTIDECLKHPNTGIAIEGQIPNWNKIVNKIIEISNYLNNTPYLTYDIVPTDTGFKILEINSHAMLRILQPFYPFYENEYQRKLFS